MPEETLLAADIIASGKTLFDDFDPNGVKGVSYDIRVGSTARIPASDGNSEYLSISLGESPSQPKVSISPGSACIIRSLEKLHMPNDIKGRISLRAYNAKRLIFFAGGIIDPGYDNYLFLPLINMGDKPLELKYGEPLVTAEFVKLCKPTLPYKPGPEPPSAFAPSSIIFDKVALSKNCKNRKKPFRN